MLALSVCVVLMGLRCNFSPAGTGGAAEAVLLLP